VFYANVHKHQGMTWKVRWWSKHWKNTTLHSFRDRIWNGTSKSRHINTIYRFFSVCAHKLLLQQMHSVSPMFGVGRVYESHAIELRTLYREAKADHKNPMRMKLHSTHPYCKYEYEVRHRALHVHTPTMSIESNEHRERKIFFQF
jgi:hypothetical protein